jgi:hypothetical protein
MDQRDERLDVTLTERLVCGANRVNAHPVRVLRGRTIRLDSFRQEPSRASVRLDTDRVAYRLRVWATGVGNAEQKDVNFDARRVDQVDRAGAVRPSVEQLATAISQTGGMKTTPVGFLAHSLPDRSAAWDGYRSRGLRLNLLLAGVANADGVGVLGRAPLVDVDKARRVVATEEPAAEHLAEPLARSCVQPLPPRRV